MLEMYRFFKAMNPKLNEALQAVGEITPQFDPEANAWFFESSASPGLEVHGETQEEVFSAFPVFLSEWLDHLAKDTVAPHLTHKTDRKWR
jgi:hypothetical protein